MNRTVRLLKDPILDFQLRLGHGPWILESNLQLPRKASLLENYRNIL